MMTGSRLGCIRGIESIRTKSSLAARASTESEGFLYAHLLDLQQAVFIVECVIVHFFEDLCPLHDSRVLIHVLS
jgi:hypothetical protein